MGWEILQFVASIPFKASHNVEFKAEDHALNEKILRQRGYANIHAARPTLVLELKRGDIRDHAMLLCCMLLGYGFDAYVCLGKVRVPGGKEREHAWVMTREFTNEAFFTERLDQQEESEKVRQKLEERLRGSGSNKALFAGAVRFWEVTTRKIFTLPSRWSPPRVESDSFDNGAGESKTEFDTGSGTQKGAASNLDEEGVQWQFEGDSGYQNYSADVAKALEKAFQCNAQFYDIPGTSLKVTFAKDNMRQIDTKSNDMVDILRIDLGGDLTNAGPADAPVHNTGEDELMQMHMEAEKEGDEGERRAGEDAPVFEYTSGMADGMSVQPIRNVLLAEHTRDHKKQKKNKAKAASSKKAQDVDLGTDIQRLLNNARKMQRNRTYRVDVPYTALYVVFNNDNLWVNTQHQEVTSEDGLFTEPSVITDPALLIYDMGTNPDYQRVGRLG